MPGKVMNLILQISELLGRLSVRSYTETSKRSAVPDIEYYGAEVVKAGNRPFHKVGGVNTSGLHHDISMRGVNKHKN